MRVAAYLVTLFCSLNLSSIVYAQDKHQDHDAGHRHHGAHVHGMATLDLVMDDHHLMMHLKSPLMNFLGFEHQPETEQQKSIYQDMLQQLKMLATLVEVQGSSCIAESIKVEEPFVDNDEAQHADVDVSYFLRCEKPENITGLKINLFDVYSNLESLQVQMVLPTGQQQLKLNQQRTSIRIQ
ncbi:DUF2796 domain-containing protein [Methylophaga sp.]|jgi:hypothetical protein|uniref:ZrgA family zinc uptake protein n=1 Tax=Methylophaga sp. TaxID=2024840 RepID=UPI000C0F0E47|nr:DUF2796 domain-containing protein [Methylophaga sp.]MBL1459250.1 DUF2796 domain-containing protein [Methylophaga sp.]|tara:strand:- start:209 stop:754 length:546 start_codon:yes stop_codon:yes gene_type:complete